MGFFQEPIFTAFLGVILTFVLAKIVSFAVSISNGEGPVAKEPSPNTVRRSPKSQKKKVKFADGVMVKRVDRHGGVGLSGDVNPVGEKIVEEREKRGFDTGGSFLENQKSSGTCGAKCEIDDDWEGIERSELEKVFAEAVNYLEYGGNGKGKTVRVDEHGDHQLASDVRMELYGLHKVAVEGSCHEPQPMAIKLSARAKWNAWQRLGSMSQDSAMEQYIRVLSDNIPNWMQDYSAADNEIQGSPVSGTTGKLPEPELERKLGPVESPVGDSSEGQIGVEKGLRLSVGDT